MLKDISPSERIGLSSTPSSHPQCPSPGCPLLSFLLMVPELVDAFINTDVFFSSAQMAVYHNPFLHLVFFSLNIYLRACHISVYKDVPLHNISDLGSVIIYLIRPLFLGS